MKKVLAIVLISAYLISGPQAEQWGKLPVIFQHYHEHLQQNSSLSFFDFLEMHYMHGSPHDDDYNRDMQLPFKIIHHSLFAYGMSVPAYPISITPLRLPVREVKSYTAHKKKITSGYLNGVFQPPRHC